MKWCRYFIALSIFASARIAMGSAMDTMDLIGGSSSNFSFGWYGEGWKVSDWCGHVIIKDPRPDTIITMDTLRDLVRSQTQDTLVSINKPDPVIFDTLTVATVSKTLRIVAMHPSPDTLVDLITINTTIIDSSIVWNCFPKDFSVTDSNGATMYIDYYYKFRTGYAQLPLVWTGWRGIDSSTVSRYKYLLIVYKGLLPTHQAAMSFFYGTWSYPFDSTLHADDSIKNAKGAGDGVGILSASPDNWKTVRIKIPDSVSMANITGLTLGIGNVAGQGGQTSDVGNVKVARVALLLDTVATVSVKYPAGRKNTLNNRYAFTPTSGSVSITAYSLKGEALASKTISVRSGKQYSIGQFVAQNCPGAASVRLVKIKGEGVNITTRMW